jgi:hypothetical protein
MWKVSPQSLHRPILRVPWIDGHVIPTEYTPSPLQADSGLLRLV